MKHKIVVVVLLITSLTLISCNDFSGIKKNKLIVENITVDDAEKLQKENKGNYLTEEEAKLKSLEILEKYFDIKLYLTEQETFVKLEDFQKKDGGSFLQKEYLKKIWDSDTKKLLQNGVYIINFLSRKTTYKQDDFNQYILFLDAKTGELLKYEVVSDEKNNDEISMEQAETIAKECIKKSNIVNIENVKLTNKDTIPELKMYTFTFDNLENSDKKIKINVDSNSGKIECFSIGQIDKIF